MSAPRSFSPTNQRSAGTGPSIPPGTTTGGRAWPRGTVSETIAGRICTSHRATGRHPPGLWRAPGGRTTQQSIRWAADCGYPIHVGWDRAGYLGDDLPSEHYSNDALLERTLKSVRNGDILLMHLGVWSRKQPLAPILGPLIRGLRQRSFCFQTLKIAPR